MAAINYTAALGLLLLADEAGVWMSPTDGITDQTANNADLTEVGTVVKSAVESDAATMEYSSFSTLNYFYRNYDSDFDPGTGNIRIRFWLKESANSSNETIYERDSTSTAQRVTIRINAAGNMEFTCDDNTTVRTVTSGVVVDDDIRRYYECIYVSGTLYIFIDGVLNNSETGTALLTLTNTSAIIRWGVSVAGTNPLTNGALSLVGLSIADAPAISQIKTIYNSEEILFHPERVYTQVGSSYDIDVEFSVTTPGKDTIKNITKTLDGSIKSLKHRNEETLDIRTLPVERGNFDTIRRFLDSVDNTQAFTLDLYGTVSSPYDSYLYKIKSDSYKETRIGANHFSTAFKVIK